jgi:poly(3-hydroxybutyrate) depolymerase
MLGCLLLFLVLVARGDGKASPLPTLNLRAKFSVSGLSSGAFAAVQLATAFSAQVEGAGVFAGGPYFCTEGSYSNVPRCGVAPGAPFVGLDDDAEKTLKGTPTKFFNKGWIDDPSNLAAQKWYLFSGKYDVTIDTDVMRALKRILGALGVPAASIKSEFSLSAGHTWPSKGSGSSSCAVAGPPYVSDCGYDGAFEMLKAIHGAAVLPRASSARGDLIEFDQTAFGANSDSEMGDEGFVFVPTQCADGAVQCTLHVAMHGCTQGKGYIGDRFARQTGLNELATANNFVVLYPQATSTLDNPIGCYDYVGSTGDDFARKSGKQNSMIMRMVQQLQSGKPTAVGSTTTAAPTTAPTTQVSSIPPTVCGSAPACALGTRCTNNVCVVQQCSPACTGGNICDSGFCIPPAGSACGAACDARSEVCVQATCLAAGQPMRTCPECSVHHMCSPATGASMR